jgi:hypothetical protein
MAAIGPRIMNPNIGAAKGKIFIVDEREVCDAGGNRRE